VKHIRSKLFAGFLCMAVLTVGMLWLIQAVIMKDSYLNERIQTIQSALSTTMDNSADYEVLETRLNISLLMTDSTGNVLYSSQGLPMRGMIMQRLPDLMKQNANSRVQYLQTGMRGTRYAVVGNTIAAGGRLFAVFSLVDVEEAARILLDQLWIITAVLLVISLVLAGILARMFARPISNVTRAAREMAEGKLDIALRVHTKDEIGQLTVALNELGAELQKTESLRRELIANVSHELRAPLSVIKGFAETVRDVTWPNEEKRTMQLTLISEEASRLSKTVNDILDYSRLQAGVEQVTIIDFKVRPILTEIINRYSIEAGKRSLSILLECPDIVLRFDQIRFIQVLDNLLNNALNHASSGSSIQVAVEQLGNRGRVSVKNAGETIPEEELGNIWDRHYRSERARYGRPLGTGLGLSIVKSIFVNHAISYGVSSKEGETVFWFETLPR